MSVVVIELWAVEAFCLTPVIACLFFVASVVYVGDATWHLQLLYKLYKLIFFISPVKQISHFLPRKKFRVSTIPGTCAAI
jgi:hypothetical protein